MRRMFGFLLLVCILFMPTLMLAQNQNKIRFGVIYFYPPFVFSSKSGYVHGLDIDIARAICQQLNAECSFQPMSLSQLFTSLNQNKIDALIGGVSITPFRQATIDFTRPYLKSTMSYVTLNRSDINIDNLTGKRVGVVKDSTFFAYLSKKYGYLIKIVTFNTNEELMTALSNKQIDLVLIDSPAANYWVGYSTGLFKTVGQPAFLDFDQGYGIGVKKGNTTLLNSLNSALNTIIQNGTFEKIKRTYFAN